MKLFLLILRCGVYFLSVLLLPVRQARSDCIFPLRCMNEKIGTDSMTVSCRDGADIVYTDTILRKKQMAAVQQTFDSVTYCFKGVVDSIVPFRTPPDGGDPCISYLVDSVSCYRSC